jgi:plasmid replication initiation protein
MNLAKKNHKVRQSNHLIESPYAQEFSEHEIKLFENTVAFCNEDDLTLVIAKTDKEFQFTNAELAKMLNTSPSVISQKIEHTASRLMKKVLHLRRERHNGEIEFEMINIIPYAKYADGILTLRLNYSIIPYVVEVNKNFTEFYLLYIRQLGSAYAIKLYKLLYQYKNIKSRNFYVYELKEQFGIAEKYSRYNDLKKDVIEPSVKQINELTDLAVQYKEIKLGRKVDKLVFTFELKKPVKLESVTKEVIDITDYQLNAADASTNDNENTSKSTNELIAKIRQERGDEYINVCIDYAKRNANSNYDAYLAKTLIQGWAEGDFKKSQSKKTATAAKVKKNQQEIEEKNKQKEQENLAKSEVENEWYKMLDSQKQQFINHAEDIIQKYQLKLSRFARIQDDLPLCIFAVNNGKHYDHVLESYLQSYLKITLQHT